MSYWHHLVLLSGVLKWYLHTSPPPTCLPTSLNAFLVEPLWSIRICLFLVESLWSIRICLYRHTLKEEWTKKARYSTLEARVPGNKSEENQGTGSAAWFLRCGSEFLVPKAERTVHAQNGQGPFLSLFPLALDFLFWATGRKGWSVFGATRSWLYLQISFPSGPSG